jgi:COMPASS component SWD3
MIWDVQTVKPITTITGHTNIVISVAISPDGRLVASGSYDGSVLLWDMHAGKQTWRFDANMGHVLTVAFSSDGRRVVAGGGRLLPVGALEDPFEFGMRKLESRSVR